MISKLRNIAIDSRDFRDFSGLPQLAGTEKLEQHTHMIHHLGEQAMRLQVDDTKARELELIEVRKKQAAAGKLLRRSIKVTDMEDGGVGIAMDQEWDTSGWSTDMIEAGCTAIICIFQNTGSSTELVRLRSLQMLGKLLFRHHQAEDFMRNTMESMISKSCNRLLRGGHSGAMLDLMYVIHNCRVKYQKELSHFTFTGKYHDMLLMEIQLAATLIQYVCRGAMMKSRNNRTDRVSDSGFGSETETSALRLRTRNARSQELRFLWRKMHSNEFVTHRTSIHERSTMVGPAQLASQYVTLGLETILHLVSDKPGRSLAPANRDDVISSHGIVQLCGFFGASDGQFSALSCHILSFVSKSAESLLPLLHIECPQACLGYMRYLKNIKHLIPFPCPVSASSPIKNYHSSFNEVNLLPDAHVINKQHEKIIGEATIPYENRQYYLVAVTILIHLSIHAAGIWRAILKKACITSAHADTEVVNYGTVLRQWRGGLKENDVKLLLGKQSIVHEVIATLLSSDDLAVVRQVLLLLFTMSCSDCHGIVLSEIMVNAGIPLSRVVDLLEDQDPAVGTLSMCLLRQLNTLTSGRLGLMSTKIAVFLKPLIQTSYSNYARLSYCRGMLAAVSLCRQYEWQPYDPETTPEHATSLTNINLRIVYDLMKTMKQDPYGEEIAVDCALSTMIMLPFQDEQTRQMAQTATKVCIGEITDYLSHPGHHNYFESLPWDLAAAACQILYGLSVTKESAAEMFSEGTIYFLGQCFFLAKHLLLNSAVTETKATIVFYSLVSAASALSNLCKTGINNCDNAIIVINGIQGSNIIGAAGYFMSTLCVSNPRLDEHMKRLQENVGLKVVEFVDSYASMLLFVRTQYEADDHRADAVKDVVVLNNFEIKRRKKKTPKKVTSPASIEMLRTKTEYMLSLDIIGSNAVEIIKNLKKMFHGTPRLHILLDLLCKMLVKIMTPLPCASIAVMKWKVMEAFQEHLPPPLSGVVGSLGVREPIYQAGLGVLPASYFHVLANACQNVQGKGKVFSGGYLRRALDKIQVIHHLLEDEEVVFMKSLTTQAVVVKTEKRFRRKSVDILEPASAVCPFHATAEKGMNRSVALDEEKDFYADACLHARADIIACLRVVAACANYHQPREGDSNELIFNARYETISICKLLVSGPSLFLRSVHDDVGFMVAVNVLAALSRDSFRCSNDLVANEILEHILRIMQFKGHLPDHDEDDDDAHLPVEVLLDCCIVIRNIANGLSHEKSLVELFPLFREPLMRMIRLYPQYFTYLHETLGIMTSVSGINTLSYSGGMEAVDSFVDKLHDEDRNSTFQSDSMAVSNVPFSGTGNSMQDVSAPGTASSGLLNVSNSSVDQVPRPGTYEACGVSSCGSLRFPDKPVQHGEFRTMSEDQMKVELLNIPFSKSQHVNDSVLDLTQLSARDKGLRDRVTNYKVAGGLVGISKTSLPTSQSLSTMPGSISLNKKDKDHLNATDYPGHPKRNKSGSGSFQAEHLNHIATTVVNVKDIPELIHTRPKMPPRPSPIKTKFNK